MDPKTKLLRAMDDVLDWFPTPTGYLQLKIYNSKIKEAKQFIASLSDQDAQFKVNQLRIDLSD